MSESRDPLFDFELKVARRADELSRQHGSVTRNAMELWSQAESELLGASPETGSPLRELHDGERGD